MKQQKRANDGKWGGESFDGKRQSCNNKWVLVMESSNPHIQINAIMAHNRADRASVCVFPKCIQRQSVKAQRRALVKATVTIAPTLLGLVPASPNCSSSS